MTDKNHEKKHEDKHHEHHHEHKGEHNENNNASHQSHKKKRNSTDKMRENPWIVSTIVLAVLAIILISTGGGAAGTGKVISSEKAGENLVGFLNQQTDGGVEYKSGEDLGSLYEITVSYQEQDIPVYITKDGKYYLQGVVNLEEEAQNTDSAGNTDNTQQQPPQEVPKSDVPEVELFTMSHCPYGTQAEKGILPVLKLLDDSIDFKLKFVYYAMHPSAGEVQEQLNQYCIQKEQPDKLYEYLECFLTEADGEGCLNEVGINKAKLEACYKDADEEFEITKNLDDQSLWLNGRFPLFNIDKELNEKYGVGGSPTLVINGEQVQSARDSASYLNVICQAFTEGNVPEECDSELSTTAYSPGFGYAAGTSTTAQC